MMKALPEITTTQAAHAERIEDETNLLVLSITRGARQEAKERDQLRQRLGLTLPELSADDEFAALAEKHREIGTRHARICRDLTEAMSLISRGLAAYRHRRIEEQGRAIADGRPVEAFQGFEELKTRVARLGEESKGYNEALRLVKAQMDEIRAERSIDATALAEPFHRQAASEIADALDALFAALRREEQIRRIVTDAGYDDRLPSFQGSIPKSADNHLARFAQRVREYRG